MPPESAKSPRGKRDQRQASPMPIRLTERDVAIIQAVHEYRVLTTQQLQQLFFPSVHQAYARLSLLYHHGFLDRKFMGVFADKMNTPMLYVLDKRGAALLQAEYGIEAKAAKHGREVSAQFLDHTVAINTVRIAFSKACADQDGFALLDWRGESELKSDYDRVTVRTQTGRSINVSLIPDSYFLLETPRGKSAFFLELDRATMPTKRFQTKIFAYQNYYDSGAYARRYGTKSLRVLTVTTSRARLENLRRVSEDAGGRQRYWFATLTDMLPPLVLTSPIWQVATQPALSPLIELT